MTKTRAAQEAPIAGLNGPVSSALEADLRSWVCKKQIVVWLDLDDHYSGFVEKLKAARQAGLLPYEVRTLRGSYLALMMELENIAGGTEKVPLVIHLPRLNEEIVQQTPLLELYDSGYRYRKALDTLVTEAAAGRVRPDQIGAFKAQPAMSLKSADAWLSALLTTSECGIGPVLQAMHPTAVFDDLLTGGFVASHVGQAESDRALWERLTAWTGVTISWREMTIHSSRVRAEDVAFAAAGWAVCVEYVHDRTRPPINSLIADAVHLPRAVMGTCCAIASHLRDRHPVFYQRTADEIEDLLADEVDSAKAEDLGGIATFRFEEDKVLAAALNALQHSEWDRAASWAGPRTDEQTSSASFWLRSNPARLSTWQLVRDAAHLGRALAGAGDRLGGRPELDGGLEAALEAYVGRGAAVDQAHRQLEQRRAALLYPQLPEFETLRARLDEMRGAWQRWADAWGRDFNTLCQSHGFLPTAPYQQRTLFDDVVRPLTQEPGPTAYFMIDALRFEMGEELFRQLESTPATTASIKPRLAELPTVTEVGMNVLAPLAKNGRLTPVFSKDAGRVLGFQAGEFRVDNPETRRRAMHERVGGAQCSGLPLEEVVARDVSSLKRSIAQARLVVVHSREIDTAGEHGLGPAVFDQVLQKLKAAWRLLREAGVRRFVFTGDHGFLLLDDSRKTVQAHGRRIDPQRRHVLTAVPADHSGEVRVGLADLGYEGATGYLMFPESIAVFDTGSRSSSFVHGGNSLQERVIPVLTLVHRAAAGGSTLQYAIKADVRDSVAGMYCLEAILEVSAQHSLDFGSPKEIEIGLRVVDDPSVQVELCQARGKARVVGGVVVATVAEKFEMFFRLAGPSDARVQVELYHPSAAAEVLPCSLDTRFAVTAIRPLSEPIPSSPSAARHSADWVQQFSDPGVRQLFTHLAAHGVVTENEAATMLGGPRGLRRFANSFEDLARKAPFGIRIDVVGGMKRYVREGRE